MSDLLGSELSCQNTPSHTQIMTWKILMLRARFVCVRGIHSDWALEVNKIRGIGRAKSIRVMGFAKGCTNTPSHTHGVNFWNGNHARLPMGLCVAGGALG